MKSAFIVIPIFLLSCNLLTESTDNKKIVFINKSDIIVDSALIGVLSENSYAIKIIKICPGDSIVSIIPYKSLQSNKHDITVSITVFIKEKRLYEYNYNDLTGYLIHDFTIILNNSGKLEMKVGN